MKWIPQPAVYLLLLILRMDSWVLKQALPVLQLSKNEAQSSLSAPVSCFVHPLHLWKKLSLSEDQSFLKACGGELFLSKVCRGFYGF